MEEKDKKERQVHLRDAGEERLISLKKKPVELSGLIKKAALYGFLGLAFLGCMFLIFGSKEEKTLKPRLNELVPEASVQELASDKRKAYEKELMEKKALEKKQKLLSLSDFWNNDSSQIAQIENHSDYENENPQENGNVLKHSSPNAEYRNIRSTMHNFYRDDSQTKALQKQVEELKQQLEQQPQRDPIEDQLALMEKSYQLASNYLPKEMQQQDEIPIQEPVEDDNGIVPVYNTSKNIVSYLHRENPQYQANSFYTVGDSKQNNIPRNSIKACIHETQQVSIGSNVALRLLESIRLENRVIPKGSMLTAMVKINNSRLTLTVESVEWESSIFPVELIAYDMDGQPGLYLPSSMELNALNEIAAQMGNSTGTNIMVSRSAGQQLAGDLSKGLVQGVSGYFSKKMKQLKVTLKAGHELLLVSKK